MIGQLMTFGLIGWILVGLSMLFGLVTLPLSIIPGVGALMMIAGIFVAGIFVVLVVPRVSGGTKRPIKGDTPSILYYGLLGLVVMIVGWIVFLVFGAVAGVGMMAAIAAGDIAAILCVGLVLVLIAFILYGWVASFSYRKVQPGRPYPKIKRG